MDQKTQYTLSQPAITYWDLKDDKIILYIEAIDLSFSAVNIYKIEKNGSSSNRSYIGTTNTSSEDGKYKIFEYPVRQNGKYTFEAQLYNPLYETSKISNPVTIYLGNYLESNGESIIGETSLMVREYLTAQQIKSKYSDDIIYDENTKTYCYINPETNNSTTINMKAQKKISTSHKPYLTNEKIKILTNEQGSKITI